MLRCIRCRAATAPGAGPRAHMISRLCTPVWLADSLATVMVLMRLAVFFMITHCSRLLRLAELGWTCSWPCLRLDVHEQHDWWLGSVQIGRKTTSGLGVCCMAVCVAAARVLWCAEAASACGHRRANACLRHGGRQGSWGDSYAAAGPLVWAARVAQVVCTHGYCLRRRTRVGARQFGHCCLTA